MISIFLILLTPVYINIHIPPFANIVHCPLHPINCLHRNALCIILSSSPSFSICYLHLQSLNLSTIYLNGNWRWKELDLASIALVIILIEHTHNESNRIYRIHWIPSLSFLVHTFVSPLLSLCQSQSRKYFLHFVFLKNSISSALLSLSLPPFIRHHLLLCFF